MIAKPSWWLALLLLVPGGSVIVSVLYLRRRSRADRVSEAWLQEQLEREREAFEGIAIKWPINKLANEHPQFQTTTLRRRA